MKRAKETLTEETKKAVQALIATLTAMIVVLTVAFLAMTNSSAQKGYTLAQEKLKNEHLKSINAGLTTKVTQATAFSQIEGSENVEKMGEAENKNYVTIEDNSVY